MDMAQKTVQESVRDIIEPVAALARRIPTESEDLTPLRRTLLFIHQAGSVPLTGVYVVTEKNDLLFPFLPTPSRAPAAFAADPDWGRHDDEVRRLEKLEFSEGKPSDALAGYLALRPKMETERQQALLLKNIATLQHKLKDFKGALASLKELTDRYDHVVDPVGDPLGLLVRPLMARVYLESGNPAESQATLRDLHESLLLGHWALSETSRAERLREIEQSSAFTGDPPLLKSATEMNVRVAQLAVTGRLFLDRQWPPLLRLGKEMGWKETGRLVFLLNPGDSPASLPAAFVVVPVPGISIGRTFLVASLEDRDVNKKMEEALTQTLAGSGLSGAWDFSPRGGGALRRIVEDTAPPLFIDFAPLSDNDHLQTLLRHRQWAYAGTIGLSLVVVLAGLIVLLHAVRRETRTAAAKAEFLANVSHELRTPLASISYIGELLKSGRARTLDEARQLHDMLTEETDRLKNLIEDILEFSKIQSGKRLFSLNPIDLRDAVDQALHRFRGKAAARNFDISFAPSTDPLPIRADVSAVVQSVMNLLDNGTKYSGDSHRLAVTTGRTARDAWVAVQDFGVGIPREEHGKIFERFYRVDPALNRHSEGGVGLGLAMVKEIMDAHGGRVQLESKPGAGSTFFLWFPLRDGGNTP